MAERTGKVIKPVAAVLGARKVAKPVAAVVGVLATMASIWWFALKPWRKPKD